MFLSHRAALWVMEEAAVFLSCAPRGLDGPFTLPDGLFAVRDVTRWGICCERRPFYCRGKRLNGFLLFFLFSFFSPTRALSFGTVAGLQRLVAGLEVLPVLWGPRLECWRTV